VLSDLIVAGKYRLRRELGQGAMGSVWSATHEQHDREVAIKFLLPSLEGSEIAAARFVAEAKAAALVKHRYVVDVFDFGVTEGGLHYMVQELLEGVALADCMYTEPAWSLPELLGFIAQCLSGLEAVHQSGIVHRDLKPENIFVIRDEEGTRPKLLDFGISKFADSSAGRSLPLRPPQRPGRPQVLTVVGMTVGTPAYMSPEQLCNAATMNGRADLYSLGVIMYEWLTGRVPFEQTSNPTELYRRIHERSAPSLKALRPELDLDLCELVDRALDPDPALRFASAAEMRAEILRVLPALPVAYSIVQRPSQVERLRPPAAVEQPSQVERLRPPASVEQPRRAAADDERVSIPGLSRSRVRNWTIGSLAALSALLLLSIAGWSGSFRSRAEEPHASPLTSSAREGLPVEPASPEKPAVTPAGSVFPSAEGPAVDRAPSVPSPAEPPPAEALPPAPEPPAPTSVAATALAEPAARDAEPQVVAAALASPLPAVVAPTDEPTSPAVVPSPVRGPAPRVVTTRRAAVPPADVRASGVLRTPQKNDKVVRTLDF